METNSKETVATGTQVDPLVESRRKPKRSSRKSGGRHPKRQKRSVATSTSSASSFNFNDTGLEQDDNVIWKWITEKDLEELLTRGHLDLKTVSYLDICKLYCSEHTTHGQQTDFNNYKTRAKWSEEKKSKVEKAERSDGSAKTVKNVKKSMDDLWQRQSKVLSRHFMLIHQIGIDYILDQGGEVGGSLTKSDTNKLYANLAWNLDTTYWSYVDLPFPLTASSSRKKGAIRTMKLRSSRARRSADPTYSAVRTVDGEYVWSINGEISVGENLTRGRLVYGFFDFVKLCTLYKSQVPTHGQPTNFEGYLCRAEWKTESDREVKEAMEAGESPKEIRKIKKKWFDKWQRENRVLCRYYTLLHRAAVAYIEEQSPTETEEEKNQRYAYLAQNLDCYYRSYTGLPDRH